MNIAIHRGESKMNQGDLVVRVDRALPPPMGWTYPINGEVAEFHIASYHYPELQGTGPKQYRFGSIRPWYKQRQLDLGHLNGLELYAEMQCEGTLPNCLGIQDLVAIQKLGPEIFQTLIPSGWPDCTTLCGWRSVAQDGYGRAVVPFLMKDQDVEGGLTLFFDEVKSRQRPWPWHTLAGRFARWGR